MSRPTANMSKVELSACVLCCAGLRPLLSCTSGGCMLAAASAHMTHTWLRLGACTWQARWAACHSSSSVEACTNNWFCSWSGVHVPAAGCGAQLAASLMAGESVSLLRFSAALLDFAAECTYQRLCQYPEPQKTRCLLI